MNIKWNFLILAILATICIGSIGIFIAEKSILGILAAIVVLCGIMGYGFSQKKKLREAGKL
ncbi:YlaF family protein [Peribacillus sp. NPDC097675]|uniref:YlaF family protein n=1 Tax=Peribacillus sp. NPDC097675 TaxID=3390618 RepID=UPI003D04FA32